MVSYDTLTSYAIQRFYSSLDAGKLVTAYGVCKSFAITFGQHDVVEELQKTREEFKLKTGMDVIDVASLGLFSPNQTIEFELTTPSGRQIRSQISGYEVYKYMLSFQMKMQELFDRAMIGSMKQSMDSSIESSSELLKGLGDSVELESD